MKKELNEEIYRSLIAAYRDLWAEQRMDAIKAHLKRTEQAAREKIENSNKTVY